MKTYNIHYKDGDVLENVEMDKDMAKQYRDDEDVKKVEVV